MTKLKEGGREGGSEGGREGRKYTERKRLTECMDGLVDTGREKEDIEDKT